MPSRRRACNGAAGAFCENVAGSWSLFGFGDLPGCCVRAREAAVEAGDVALWPDLLERDVIDAMAEAAGMDSSDPATYGRILAAAQLNGVPSASGLAAYDSFTQDPFVYTFSTPLAFSVCHDGPLSVPDALRAEGDPPCFVEGPDLGKCAGFFAQCRKGRDGGPPVLCIDLVSRSGGHLGCAEMGPDGKAGVLGKVDPRVLERAVRLASYLFGDYDATRMVEAGTDDPEGRYPTLADADRCVLLMP